MSKRIGPSFDPWCTPNGLDYLYDWMTNIEKKDQFSKYLTQLFEQVHVITNHDFHCQKGLGDFTSVHRSVDFLCNIH